MKTLRIAALAVAVSGVFTLGAKAGTDTNNWWDVTFDDKLGLCDLENQTVGPDGAMVVLTNQFKQGDGATVSVQTWDSGIWYTQDGDETIVTNSYNPTNTYKAYGSDLCLKLDTQGNDLTWRVDPTNTMADSLTALVDADLYLVGSDSPPDAGDFDASGDVQTAVYLKNETDEDTGETTNSVLCVYARNAGGQNYWQELKGVTLKDNSWASVKVVVDHAKVIDPQNPYPVVQVFVNGVKMTARDGDADYWTAANPGNAQEQGRVSSVAFRGTGAVDNFVGKLVETTFDSYNFTAQVFMDGTNVLATGNEGNVTRTVYAESGAGKSVTFANFLQDDLTIEWPEDEEEDPIFHVSYALSKIEFVNLGSGETTTFNYSYSNYRVVPETVNEDLVHLVSSGEPPFAFSVMAPTEGATKDDTIVNIYFETLPSDGDFKLTATQNVGTAPADQKYNVSTLTTDAATFTFAESISDGGTSYILSKIKPGTAPTANPITMAYESPNAVVTVPIDNQIAEGIYNVATATYVEGTLGDRVLGYEWDATNGEWSFTAKDKPVAIIVADSGATTNEYATLAAAVAAVQDGETVVLVSTIANESVLYTGTAAFTIDLNGQTWNYLDGENGNWAAFKNNGATVTFKDSSEAGTGKIYCNGDGFCIWSRTGSVVIESGSFVNNSHEDYAIYLGTDDANFVGGVPPTITITGGSFVNEDNAPYNNKPAWSRLVLNVMNSNATTRTLVKTELIQVSGGSYSWDPALGDDNMGGSFVAEGYKSVYDDTTGLYNVVPDAEEFTITFVNGETTLYTTTAYAGFAPVYQGETPAKEATAQFTYAFAGWTNAVAGGPLYAGELPAAAGDTTYTAAFTETVNRYDVTFTVDGTTVATTNAPYGDTLYGPADPVKTAETGYEVAFAGWTNAVAGGATVTAANLPEVTGDATWAAVFTTTAIEYRVTVALDGGTLASGDSIPETYTVETAAFTLPTPTKEGFTFKGWVDGDNQPVTQIAGGTTGDISLTATWEEDSVEVHVNPGDGLDTIENAPAPIEFTAAGLCKIAFKAPAAGKYVLMTSTTVNGTYQAEGTPTAYEAGALVQLTETASAPTKFFKIGYEK